jgi:tRNA nucleotidyltransferase (CCA-adding enzyme)
MIPTLPASLARILRETPELAHAYLVGGCVRDGLLGHPCKDFDIEVYGINPEALQSALARWGRIDAVGKSFGVVKLSTDGHVFDFSLPRRDSKSGPGHRGFEITFDPALSPREAASRRDFTINAMMFDPHRQEVLDFFGGEADLRNRVLRHTSAAFIEDPLRVLRGMQFAGRLNLTAAPETLALCRQIAVTHSELAVERVREEWIKWATKSVCPSAGLRFLRDSGWLVHYPELAALVGVPQDPEWHPEGDVWTHTLACLDALVSLPAWQDSEPRRRLFLSLAVLAHDFGKPACTHEADRGGRRRIVSPGHEPAGGPLAAAFLERLAMPESYGAPVVPLVINHLVHLNAPTPRGVRRLAQRLIPATIEDLLVVITADSFGRPPRPRDVPPGVTALREAAAQLQLEHSAPRPILQGRHLTASGHAPGPSFKRILDAAFEAQLDGEFQDLDGALVWLQSHPID